jgi:putative glycerol-1-phosphate prenyltransferase
MITGDADGLLLLSLISGRNAEMLIGKHVLAAPFLKTCNFEILPTGYMLIENGHHTAVSYMSNTEPIPSGQDDIALCTAVAGELLGLQLIYMDAGSGAENPVSPLMIKKVKQNISIPLIIGGGICTAKQAKDAAKAGADVVVVGNAIEKNLPLISELCDAVHSL